MLPNVGFTGSGLHLSFTQLASDEYSFRIDGNAITNSGLTLTASDISRVRIFKFNAGGSADSHFTSLSVTPEPSVSLLGALAGLLRRRRRRRPDGEQTPFQKARLTPGFFCAAP